MTLPYNTDVGYLASTTGNITGIYDMSGGAWEYLIGVMTDQNGNLMSGSDMSNYSGFNGQLFDGNEVTTGNSWPDSRYYDRYDYGDSETNYLRGRLGDATKELGPFQSIIYANNEIRKIGSWYGDYAHFMYDSLPWSERGGDFNSGSDTGMFAFGRFTGAASDRHTFRVVLSL